MKSFFRALVFLEILTHALILSTALFVAFASLLFGNLTLFWYSLINDVDWITFEKVLLLLLICVSFVIKTSDIFDD